MEELEGAVCPHLAMSDKIPKNAAVVMDDEQKDELEGKEVK